MEPKIDSSTALEGLPQFLSVAQVQAYLGIGRSAAYDFARVHGIRIGSRTVRVPRQVLEELVRRKSA